MRSKGTAFMDSSEKKGSCLASGLGITAANATQPNTHHDPESRKIKVPSYIGRQLARIKDPRQECPGLTGIDRDTFMRELARRARHPETRGMSAPPLNLNGAQDLEQLDTVEYIKRVCQLVLPDLPQRPHVETEDISENTAPAPEIESTTSQSVDRKLVANMNQQAEVAKALEDVSDSPQQPAAVLCEVANARVVDWKSLRTVSKAPRGSITIKGFSLRLGNQKADRLK